MEEDFDGRQCYFSSSIRLDRTSKSNSYFELAVEHVKKELKALKASRALRALRVVKIGLELAYVELSLKDDVVLETVVEFGDLFDLR